MSIEPSPGSSSTTRTGRWSFLDALGPDTRSFSHGLRILATTLLIAATVWLLLRERVWPANSHRDWGGLGLITISSFIAFSSLPLSLRWSWMFGLPAIVSLGLLGHVGPQSTVLLGAIGFALSGLGIMLKLSMKSPSLNASVTGSSNNRTDDSPDRLVPHAPPSESVIARATSDPRDLPTATCDSGPTTHLEPAEEMESSGPEITGSDRSVSDIEARLLERLAHSLTPGANDSQATRKAAATATAVEEEEEEAEEVDEESDSANQDSDDNDTSILQQWKRWHTDSQECVSGFVTVELEPEAQVAWIHVPFWPPLQQTPKIEFPVDTAILRVKVTQAETFGFRAEVKLVSRAAVSSPVRVAFVATASCS